MSPKVLDVKGTRPLRDAADVLLDPPEFLPVCTMETLTPPPADLLSVALLAVDYLRAADAFSAATRVCDADNAAHHDDPDYYAPAHDACNTLSEAWCDAEDKLRAALKALSLL